MSIWGCWYFSQQSCFARAFSFLVSFEMGETFHLPWNIYILFGLKRMNKKHVKFIPKRLRYTQELCENVKYKGLYADYPALWVFNETKILPRKKQRRNKSLDGEEKNIPEESRRGGFAVLALSPLPLASVSKQTAQSSSLFSRLCLLITRTCKHLGTRQRPPFSGSPWAKAPWQGLWGFVRA